MSSRSSSSSTLKLKQRGPRLQRRPRGPCPHTRGRRPRHWGPAAIVVLVLKYHFLVCVSRRGKKQNPNNKLSTHIYTYLHVYLLAARGAPVRIKTGSTCQKPVVSIPVCIDYPGFAFVHSLRTAGPKATAGCGLKTLRRRLIHSAAV